MPPRTSGFASRVARLSAGTENTLRRLISAGFPIVLVADTPGNYDERALIMVSAADQRRNSALTTASKGESLAGARGGDTSDFRSELAAGSVGELMRVVAVDRPDVAPLEMPARFKRDVAYFMTPAGQRGAPAHLPVGEFWIDPDEARRWLDEGVLEVISPLDSSRQAELEITEDQETWLQWLITHGIRHVRLES